ncbi:MAG TPA: ubiquinol-cytochrome c reductase cytochrome b subunit [Nitriliruptorales bacterium]|nr:ubiquinol-cytochrome c reductase cytochrome b subunit [Nitriliruptorales bacterium]
MADRERRRTLRDWREQLRRDTTAHGGHAGGPVPAVARWLDDRLGLAKGTRALLRKPFPGHWSFLIGEIALFALVVLFLTGTFLALFYRPDTRVVTYEGPYLPLKGSEVSIAYESMLRLSFEVRAGLLMRQIHHHAANVFMAAVVAHMFRTFFTGAFRRPRELLWVTGVALLILGIGAGFTGYSLPDDLLSGTGLQIAYGILLSVPLVGPFLAFVLLGGELPNPDVLGRLHILHVMIIPGGLVALVTAHLAILFRVRHTQHPGGPRTDRNVVGKPMFPTQTMISGATFAATVAVLALLGGLYEINPVWVYGPFEPARVFAPTQPDWYVGWLEGVFRLWPAWSIHLFGIVVPQPFIPGVVVPGLIFTLAILWPWIEVRWITHDREERNLLQLMRDNPVRSAIGTAGLTFLTVMFLAGSNDVLAALFVIHLENVTLTLRTLLVVGPPVVGWLTYRWLTRLRRRDVEEARAAPRGEPRSRSA